MELRLAGHASFASRNELLLFLLAKIIFNLPLLFTAPLISLAFILHCMLFLPEAKLSASTESFSFSWLMAYGFPVSQRQ